MPGSQEKVEIVATAKDQASATLKTLNRNVQALGSKGRGPLGGLLSGLGGISPVALAAGFGIGALSGLLADGVAGAIAEEKQLAALSQALRDNVKGWDGNTDAVNHAARAAEDFAFTDDDARASLLKLVPATGSVEASIKDMNLAMDIARGRNVDLATATDIVVKANMGNVGALRRMGIEVEKNATSTQILAELQKRYAGQAAAFADTTEGKMQTAHIQIDELAESFSEKLLPAIGDAAQAMTNFLTDFERPKGNVEKAKDAFFAGLPTEEELRARLQALQDLAHSYQFGSALDPKTYLFSLDIGGTKTELNKQISDLQTYLNTLVDPRDESALGLRLGQQITNSIASGAEDAAPKAAQQIVAGSTEAFYEYWSDKPYAKAGADAGIELTHDLAGTLKGNKDVVKNAMDTVTWAVNHPLKMQRELARIEGALTTLQYKLGLAEGNPGLTTIINQQMDILKTQWSSITGVAYTAGVGTANAYERGLGTFRTPDWLPVNLKGSGRHHRGGSSHPGRAAGGPVDAGETYLVGERGPEVLHMGNRSNGYVQAGGGHGHDIYMDGQRVAQLLDRRQGRMLALSPSSDYSR